MHPLSVTEKQSWLIFFLRGILFLGLTILIARSLELQVIKGGYFRSLSEGNRIRRVPISAPRGEILARSGEVLVGNTQTPKQVVFDPDSGWEKVEAKDDTPSDEIITESERHYLLGGDFAHVSGYLGLVTEEEVGKIDSDCPDKGPRKLGEWVGRGGLESQYGCILKGIDGEELVEVDSMGKKIRTLGTKPPTPGSALKTTIDFSLQAKVASVIREADIPGGKKAAVIATDGKGEVLAFYSSPSFDPKEVGKYLGDPELPLFNRVIGGAYHPGSIFKVVTALAALQEGKIKEDFNFEDQGVISVKEFSYSNWYFTQYGRVEGKIDLERALARSTDTFFYKVGEFLGAENLSRWAKTFGLDSVTGVDLPGEITGLVPTPEWKKAVKKEAWFLGNTYHMSIGQGDITTTPIGANVMTSIVASKGELCTPHIAASVSQNCKRIDIEEKYFNKVINGMVQACDTGGTAYPFFDFEPQVACKTGTAETEEEDKTHAWFTIFAPAEDPEIVLTVLVEKGGEGSRIAAPLAHKILNYWFHERN